jgi:hypothetical protein
MIRYIPARKSKDIYSNELVAEIAKDLGINEDDKINTLKEILERAYLDYQKNKQRQSKQGTNKKEDKELLRFLKSMEKSVKILEELFETSLGSGFRILRAIKSLDTIHEEERAALLLLIYKEGPRIKTNTINNILNVISNSCKNALSQRHTFEKQTDTVIVFFWMANFIDFWEAFSEIKISEGREYVSPALRIIEKMIKPLNENIDRDYRITLSLVSEAIKLYRKNYDPDTNFNPFIDDPKDIGQ